MDTLTVLREARAWLSDPDHWTKGAGFRDDNGVECVPEAASATCAYGACQFAASRRGVQGGLHPYFRALDDALPDTLTLRYSSLYNDAPATTHADILALFDRAIAAEEAKLQPAPEIVPQATPRRRDDVGCETRERVAA